MVQGPSAEYNEDSHIIHAHSSESDGLVFMPFGLQRSALVISWEPGSKSDGKNGLYVEWNHPVLSQKAIRMFGIEMQLLKFNHVQESLLLIPLGPKQKESAGSREYLASRLAWALISLESDDDLKGTVQEFNRWRNGLTPQALAEREVQQVENWRVKPTVHFASEQERHLWRQSEVMLRIAQSREPNRPGRHGNGLIVASLPDGVWFTPWVRDMAWAAVALARMGHRDEARAALLAYFNAQPTGKMRAETNGARTTRFRWCAILATARRSRSSPWRAAPILSSTTGVRRSGCWANTCEQYDDAALLTIAHLSRPALRERPGLHREAADREHGEVRRWADRRGRYVDLGGAAEGQEAFRVFHGWRSWACEASRKWRDRAGDETARKTPLTMLRCSRKDSTRRSSGTESCTGRWKKA